MITIRKATIEDLKTIQDLYSGLHDFEALFTDEFDKNWSYSEKGKKLFEKRLKGYKSIIFIAEEDDKPVGFALTHVFREIVRYRAEIAKLEYLFIKEEVRGKGVGSMLVSETKKILKKKKIPRLKVVAMTNNSNAISFYKKHGFSDFASILEMDL